MRSEAPARAVAVQRLCGEAGTVGIQRCFGTGFTQGFIRTQGFVGMRDSWGCGIRARIGVGQDGFGFAVGQEAWSVTDGLQCISRLMMCRAELA